MHGPGKQTFEGKRRPVGKSHDEMPATREFCVDISFDNPTLRLYFLQLLRDSVEKSLVISCPETASDELIEESDFFASLPESDELESMEEDSKDSNGIAVAFVDPDAQGFSLDDPFSQYAQGIMNEED